MQFNLDDFRKIAARIAADVAAGRLRPGDRLPPQRRFAYEQGIAPSTAGRVYGELTRRGIATGEVGRGTFVAAPAAKTRPALAEPPSAPVDMETNYPILPDQQRLLVPALALLASRADALEAALAVPQVQGDPTARQAVATALAEPGWRPAPDSFLFAGNGRQALAAAFSALAPVGSRIAFEALTYPVARAIAARLGITAVPLAMDAQGVRPEAVAKAHRRAPLAAIYLQPTLQNPLGITMPEERRRELAELLQRLKGPIAVEDRVYAFLEERSPPPLAALAPEHVVAVDSLSKRIAPGLTLGFLSAPQALVPGLANALVSGAWTAQGYPLDLGVRWLADGTAKALGEAKRADAKARQAIAKHALTGLSSRVNPAAYHLLLDLPAPWRADAFVQAAARQGIAISPASAFAVTPGHAPNAVRLALAAPPLKQLKSALKTLAALARRDAE